MLTIVTILNDLATAAGIGSALWLAIPAIRAASLQGDKAAIEAELSSTDANVRRSQEASIADLTRQIARSAGADRRAIKGGRGLLILSAFLFLAAILLPWLGVFFRKSP